MTQLCFLRMHDINIVRLEQSEAVNEAQLLKMTRLVRQAVDQARTPPTGGGASGTESDVRMRDSTRLRMFCVIDRLDWMDLCDGVAVFSTDRSRSRSSTGCASTSFDA